MTRFELSMLYVESYCSLIGNNVEFEDVKKLSDDDCEDEEEQKTVILIFNDPSA